jgi:hypothetical protein
MSAHIIARIIARTARTALLSASAIVALAFALGPDVANAQNGGRQSFSIGFNTSSGYRQGWNNAGYYNNNYANSQWGLQLQSNRYNNGPLGGNSQGFNFGVGGGQQRQWGTGWGAGSPYGYNNYNRDQWGYFNGYRRQW